MKIIKVFIGFIFLLFICFPAFGWQGKVASVHDGDSLRVVRLEDRRHIKVRLSGIDAPEMSVKGRWQAQPYCKASRDLLREILPVGSIVTIVDMGTDKYGRTLATVVSLPDGRVVQEELLRSGLAWVYRRYCKSCDYWIQLEEDARKNMRGLWRDNHPIPPWEWRKKQITRGSL